MDMKNINYKINSLKIVSVFLLLAVACSKDEVSQLSLSRQFSPSKFTFTNGETQSTVAWSASLFTTTDQQVSYTVEVDSTTDFLNPAFTATTTDLSVIVTNNMIPIKKNYYARVKALGHDKTAESNWAVSSSFKILGEQFLNPVTSDKVIDKSVRLTWRPGPDFTKIIITPPTGPRITFSLTAADLAATLKQIDNLTPGAKYTAEIFAGTLSKGEREFTTVAPLTGNVIDLRDISVVKKPSILTDTLPDIPSGSTVLLKRGSNYTLTAAYKFDRSVTIQSGLDFGTNLAIIRVNGNSFDFALNANIDSIVFRTLMVKGLQSAWTAGGIGYLINGNSAATVKKIKVDNCTLKILRGVLRAQAGTTGVKVTNYYVNNCVIDSIREYGIATASTAPCVFANISITNTTVYRTRRFIVHALAGNTSINIENCTFNELVSGAASASNYFIDFNTFNSNIKINNTIFGKVWNETNAGTVVGGIRTGGTPNTSGSYNSSDFVNTTSPIPGLTAYSGTAAALFVDPNNGNFKFLDSNFIGRQSAGDPRWR
jgi:hypothetical protein